MYGKRSVSSPSLCTAAEDESSDRKTVASSPGTPSLLARRAATTAASSECGPSPMAAVTEVVLARSIAWGVAVDTRSNRKARLATRNSTPAVMQLRARSLPSAIGCSSLSSSARGRQPLPRAHATRPRSGPASVRVSCVVASTFTSSRVVSTNCKSVAIRKTNDIKYVISISYINPRYNPGEDELGGEGIPDTTEFSVTVA